MEKIEIYSEKLETLVSISAESAQAEEVVGWNRTNWQRS